MKKQVRKLYLILAIIGGVGISCERVEPFTPQVQPTFSSIQQNVFSINCALSGCHAGSSPQQGMNLSDGQAYSNIVNIPSMERPTLFRIDPDNADSSYLFMKITGASTIVGSQMPLGGPQLSVEKINAIREWIESGAANN